MRAVIGGVVFLVALYMVCWTIIYALIMAGDFRYFFQYLSLAWSRPGELPALIQLYTLIVTTSLCLAAGVALLAMRLMRRR